MGVSGARLLGFDGSESFFLAALSQVAEALALASATSRCLLVGQSLDHGF